MYCMLVLLVGIKLRKIYDLDLRLCMKRVLQCKKLFRILIPYYLSKI
jgi:hypothetical protein